MANATTLYRICKRFLPSYCRYFSTETLKTAFLVHPCWELHCSDHCQNYLHGSGLTSIFWWMMCQTQLYTIICMFVRESIWFKREETFIYHTSLFPFNSNLILGKQLHHLEDIAFRRKQNVLVLQTLYLHNVMNTKRFCVNEISRK